MTRFTARVPSPAMVVAIVAVVLALIGTAYAAGTKIGTKQLKNGAVATKSIKNEAITGAKLQNGAVTGAKLADGSITAAKLAPGTIPAAPAPVVTPAPAATPPTPGFFSSNPDQVELPAAEEEFQAVAQLNLPAGAYIVNASVDLAGKTKNEQFVSCRLFDDGDTLSSGTTPLFPEARFVGGVALTGASDGGEVDFACETEKGTKARNAVITAIRVDSLERQ